MGFALSAALLLGIGLGCAGFQQRSGYDYFVQPEAGDAWSAKITGWQLRERADTQLVDTPAVNGPGEASAGVGEFADDLRDTYESFRLERKRQTARAFAEWIQREARRYYIEDGAIDHWATLEETLRGNGDDCDGLELLVFHALRDLGFTDHEVYRAIVFRPSDGQHHMVTLWFEDRSDPWVIDPTGAMSQGLRRMSAIPDWVPLKVFSDTAEYSVRSGQSATRPSFASNP